MALWKPFGKKDSSPPVTGTPIQSDPPTDTGEPTQESPAPESVSRTEEPQLADSDFNPPVADPPATAKSDTPPNEPEKSKGMFGRFKSALKKTVDVLNTDIRDLVKEGRLVDDEFLDELFADLVKTDMGVGPAGKIRDGIQTEFRGRKLFMSDLVGSAKSTITKIINPSCGEVE